MEAPLPRPQLSRSSKRQINEEAADEEEEDAREEAVRESQRAPVPKKANCSKLSPLTEYVRSRCGVCGRSSLMQRSERTNGYDGKRRSQYC